MKKLGLISLVAGATMFIALGATTASASDMKCGAGKCGSMEKPAKKCGAEKKASKCGAGKCGSMEKPAKKCGAEKKAPAKSMKCGAGKCGGSK